MRPDIYRSCQCTCDRRSKAAKNCKLKVDHPLTYHMNLILTSKKQSQPRITKTRAPITHLQGTDHKSSTYRLHAAQLQPQCCNTRHFTWRSAARWRPGHVTQQDVTWPNKMSHAQVVTWSHCIHTSPLFRSKGSDMSRGTPPIVWHVFQDLFVGSVRSARRNGQNERARAIMTGKRKDKTGTGKTRTACESRDVTVTEIQAALRHESDLTQHIPSR